jgi:hypothetical protein
LIWPVADEVERYDVASTGNDLSWNHVVSGNH